MPTLLQNIDEKNANEQAKLAARSFYVSDPILTRNWEHLPSSLSIQVTLADKTEVIVQLRDNEIDLSKFVIARNVLGQVVPQIQVTKDTDAYFAYVISLNYGLPWNPKQHTPVVAQEAHMASQIARILAKSSLGIDSSGTIDHYIRPRLQQIIVKECSSNDATHACIKSLYSKVDELKSLPLVISHGAIEANDIIVNNSLDIVAVIGWERGGLLPFGIDAWSILSLCTNSGNEAGSIVAKAFWEGLTAGRSEDFRRAVVIAMQIGYLLIHAYPEGYSPTPDRLPKVIERLDWLKDTFEPLCA
ncbi:aminoglycoside phosphotransferase [Moniliophthora roreri]|uniref:Aminoglycoside phosphotransferase domain-containing protein n=1 Tax=Moniliophthora roreri TaxID=221103 RepID=A0A0W0GE87_MONRR|nr:aminoglycoside phosphotransferase [Moniliophthora roreri]